MGGQREGLGDPQKGRRPQRLEMEVGKEGEAMVRLIRWGVQEGLESAQGGDGHCLYPVNYFWCVLGFCSRFVANARFSSVF